MPRFSWMLLIAFWASVADEPTAQELAHQLSDSDVARVTEAVESLGKRGAAAEPALRSLVRALADERESTRTTMSIPGGFETTCSVSSLVHRALVQIGEPAVPYLVEDLRRKRHSTRSKVVEILREIGPPAQPALPDLEAIVQSTVRNSLRRSAIVAWVAIAPRVPGNLDSIRTLGRWIDDRDPEIRAYAIDAVSLWRTDGGVVAPDLIRHLDDESLYREWISGCMFREVPLSRTVCQTLGRIGPSAWKAIPHLAEIMRSHPSAETRVAAALAFCQIDLNSEDGIRVLIAEFDPANQRDSAPLHAIHAIGTIGSRARFAWDSLAKRNPQDKSEKSAILFAMSQIDGERAIDPLIKALESKDDESLQEDASRYLGKLGARSVRAVPALVKALKNPGKRYVELAVLEALGQIGPSANVALPHLQILADRETDDFTRKAIVDAIQAIREEAPAKASDKTP